MRRGRLWFFGWLIFFLAVAAVVTGRQTAGLVLATRLSEREQFRSDLEAERAQLLQRIRTAQSRAVLIPKAQALGLELPTEAQIRTLRLGGER